LLSSGSSWRAVYSTPVLLSIPAGLLALAASARAKGGGASSSKLDLRALLVAKDPIFLLLALATFSHMGMAIGSTAWLPTYLMLHGGFDPKLAGLTIGLFWGCVGLGRLVLAKVPEGVGLERSLTIFAISAGFLSWAGISAKDPYATMALWALSGLAFSTTLPSVLALLVREVPGATGSAMGLLFSIGMVGSIFSQWAIGFLGGLTSLALSIHCVSLFAFAMGLIPLAMPLAMGSKGKAPG
jgi:fucose permease